MENRTAVITISNEQYNISEEIKIVQSSCKAGDIATIYGGKGIVYFANSSTTKIISVEETYNNWDDAETWCSNYGSYRWKLPTRDELIEVGNYCSIIDSALTANGYEMSKIGVDWYWSSTYDPDNTFWGKKYCVKGSCCYKSEMPDKYYSVRAICIF